MNDLPANLNECFGKIERPFELPYPPNTLSVIMIVKNEASNIEAAVKTFSPFADEIIINDTGSIDNTREMAHYYPNDNVKYFESKWEDDFSIARNQAREKASCSWVIWLDADDRISEEEAEKFNQLKTAPLDRMFAFQVINAKAGNSHGIRFNQFRMFPNHPELKFERAVHEQIVFSAARLGLRAIYTDAIIHHTGYEDEETQKEKARRNLRLAFKEKDLIGSEPAFTMSIGDAHYILGNWKQGVEAYKMAFYIPHLQDIHKDVYESAPERIGVGYLELKRYDIALFWFDKSISINDSKVEPMYHKALTYSEMGNIGAAEECYRKVIDMTFTPSATGTQYDRIMMLAYHSLATILKERWRHDEAIEVLEGMHRKYPDVMESWLMLSQCYRIVGDDEKSGSAFLQYSRINKQLRGVV